MTKKGKIRTETKPPRGAAAERAGGEENEPICQSGQKKKKKRDGRLQTGRVNKELQEGRSPPLKGRETTKPDQDFSQFCITQIHQMIQSSLTAAKKKCSVRPRWLKPCVCVRQPRALTGVTKRSRLYVHAWMTGRR